MSERIKSIISQFELQTSLMKNVTVGINDSDAQSRLNENTNHIAWLTGHIVSIRFMIAGALGSPTQEPFPELFENGKGLDNTAQYPSMEDLMKDWDSISEKDLQLMNQLTEEALSQKMPRPVPTGDTLGDFLVFLLHHEAYTLGQIGISRRFFGLEAMSYA